MTPRNPTRFALCVFVLAVLSTATVTGAAPPGEPIAPDSLVVLYGDDSITVDDFRALSAAGLPPSHVKVRNARLVEVTVPADADAEALIEAVRDHTSVVAVARNARVHGLSAVPPDDTRYSHEITGGTFFFDQQTYLGPTTTDQHAIGLETVWDATMNGDSFTMNTHRPGVTVAVMDTGVTSSLMEDTARYIPVWNYVDGTTDTADRAAPGFHGTATASIIAAKTDNRFAIAGTLYDVDNRVLVYKVLDDDQGDVGDVMVAMMDAANQRAKVISLSLGHRATLIAHGAEGTVPDIDVRALWQRVVDYCAARGTLVVAASGNEGSGGYPHVYYPAACEGVLAVGAIDPATGRRSTFSSYGPQLDVVAAGERVWVARPNGTTAVERGTSFAAPVVAGAVAYLWSLIPDLTPAQMLAFARDTADGSYGPNPGFDEETGYGRFDAAKAYDSMKTSVPVQSPVSLAVVPVNGREVRLSWSAAAGGGVFYRYSHDGGPEYQTTARTGRLVLTSDGTHTVNVRSFASDRWGAQSPATTTVSVSTGSAPLTSVRYEGSDRYRTAASISGATFPSSAPAVVVASGQNWPDGLAGGVLAAVTNGPLLLTRTDRLSLEVRDEVLRSRPTRIYILGGRSAISPAVESAIGSLLPTATITRLGGEDRYDTARLIALEVRRRTGVLVDGRVIIASGENYPDALAGSALAAAYRTPILLTRHAHVPSPTQAAFAALKPTTSIVLGGESAISAAVFRTLPNPTRIPGRDRYETSRRIAEHGIGRGVFSSAHLGLATGRAFPDALAAAQALGGRRTPLLLADSATEPLLRWLGDRGPTVNAVVLFGGPAAMPYDLEFDVKGALRRP